MSHQRENINLGLIIEGCMDGKRSHQRRLYETFYGYALAIALNYSKNRQEAVEILNDGFLKVFRHLDRYDKERPFRIWLRKIIVNASIDYMRRYSLNYESVEWDSASQEMAETKIDLPAEIDVLPYLQKLSPQYRMVFNLYVIEGYKHDEIAEILGISVSTSRSNLLRAKANLKYWLSDYKPRAKAN